MKRARTITIDATKLGPHGYPGAVMQAWWPDRIEHLVHNGTRWVKLCGETITARDLARGYMPTPHWGSHR